MESEIYVNIVTHISLIKVRSSACWCHSKVWTFSVFKISILLSLEKIYLTASKFGVQMQHEIKYIYTGIGT